MPRHAFLGTDRLDAGWDQLGALISDEITGLRDRARYVVLRRRTPWSIALRRDGSSLTATVGTVARREIPLSAQAGLLDLGWGLLADHVDDRTGYAVTWRPEHPLPRPRWGLRRRQAWLDPLDQQDAVDFLLRTLRGPLQVLAADMITVR